MLVIHRLTKMGFPLIRSAIVMVSLIIQLLIPSDFARAQEQREPNTRPGAIQFSKTTIEGHQLAYAYAGDVTKPGIIFLHGTPGSWSAFDIYLANARMQRDFFMISVDRLGWGRSPIPSELIDGDFSLQARSIVKVMRAHPSKTWTIVGHSLGASMAPKVALIAPEKTHSLVLLAGSLDPKLGKPRWYNRAASTWVVSRFIGKTMRYSNREIMGLRKQLELQHSEIKNRKLDIQLVLVQGGKDRLVSPKNSGFVEREWRTHFANVDIVNLPEEGHFLPWRQTQKIINIIYALHTVANDNSG